MDGKTDRQTCKQTNLDGIRGKKLSNPNSGKHPLGIGHGYIPDLTVDQEGRFGGLGLVRTV